MLGRDLEWQSDGWHEINKFINSPAEGRRMCVEEFIGGALL